MIETQNRRVLGRKKKKKLIVLKSKRVTHDEPELKDVDVEDISFDDLQYMPR